MSLPPGAEYPHFLFAGDSNDLPFIQATLLRTSMQTYGQVYIEVATAIQIRALDVPDRISVTWLCRDEAGIDRPMAPRGERLVSAIRAWCDEWMADESQSPARVVWIGGATSPQVSRLHRELRDRYPELHQRPAGAVAVDQTTARKDSHDHD